MTSQRVCVPSMGLTIWYFLAIVTLPSSFLFSITSSGVLRGVVAQEETNLPPDDVNPNPIRTMSSVPYDQGRDPALHEMTYDVGDGPQTTWVYIEPNVTTFYQNHKVLPASTKVQPEHEGFAGKFINLSNKKATLYWEEREGGRVHVMREHEPMSASGTATFPGHRFFFGDPNDPKKIYQRFLVGNYPENIYVYDPYYDEKDPMKSEQNANHYLSPEERTKYTMWRKTLIFHQQYLNFTGRSYLANYLRESPTHFMWRADYLNQEYWITSPETHFIQDPPPNLIGPILDIANGELRQIQQPLLPAYRNLSQNGLLNMTLKVISCAPRVFEIPNFLSKYEVQHILDLAAEIDLKVSTTGDGDKPSESDSRKTRTSFNSWVGREQTTIIDSIYRRAADLLRIDEALLRYRGPSEYPNIKTKKSIAESLQLVHYDVTQQYTAHHDFGFSRIDDKGQDARYATLLLYLNEGMKGGETSFPRWVNAETFRELKVTPKIGQAILFYSQLPDGNLDDFSHHAALPVTAGEKWLINLWVWDPTYE